MISWTKTLAKRRENVRGICSAVRQTPRQIPWCSCLVTVLCLGYVPLAVGEPGAQDARYHAQIKASNPQYNGKGRFVIEQGSVVEARLGGTGIHDLSFLRDWPLRTLNLRNNPVSDLSPLRGKKLTFLDLAGTSVVDLTPLQDMPLEQVNLYGAKVTDLSPLSHARIRWIDPVGQE